MYGQCSVTWEQFLNSILNKNVYVIYLQYDALKETHRVIERDITMYDIRKAVSENRVS